MSGLKERLGRLTRSTGGGRGSYSESAAAQPTDSAAAAADDGWSALGFAMLEGPMGACLVREATFRTEHKHGRFAMGELSAVSGALSRIDPSGRTLEPQKLLFLDTETTGLGQGAGNVPFLIGAGRWSEAGFTVRQYLIRHPGEEAAMLAMLAETVHEVTHLVTYNGRSFDWPLVKNRYVLNRLQQPRDPAHFDFLYPSRSLWRTTMPSCRLGAVEEGILGVFREDDVPGSLAPELYFRYLAEGDPSVLSGVIKHNETDILTLLSLAVHFGRLLSGEVELSALSTNELVRLGLWYERLGFATEADRVFETAASRRAEESLPQLGEAAQYFKRHKRWDQAAALWKAMVEASRGRPLPTLEPYVELAMAYEHRFKDADEALYWADEALKSAQRRLSLTGSALTEAKVRETIAAIQKRRSRLIKKQRTLF